MRLIDRKGLISLLIQSEIFEKKEFRIQESGARIQRIMKGIASTIFYFCIPTEDRGNECKFWGLT